MLFLLKNAFSNQFQSLIKSKPLKYLKNSKTGNSIVPWTTFLFCLAAKVVEFVTKWLNLCLSTVYSHRNSRVSQKQLRTRYENVCFCSEQHLFLLWYVLVRFDDDLPDVTGGVVVRRGRQPGPVEGRRDHTGLPHQLIIFQPHSGSLYQKDTY